MVDPETFAQAAAAATRTTILPDLVTAQALAAVLGVPITDAERVLRGAGAREVAGRLVLPREDLLTAIRPAHEPGSPRDGRGAGPGDPDAPRACAGGCGRRVRPSRAVGYGPGPSAWCVACARAAEDRRADEGRP